MRRKLLFSILVVFDMLFSGGLPTGTASQVRAANGGTSVYLPVISKGAVSGNPSAHINVPYISGETDNNGNYTHIKEMGVFWFGQITRDDNYADVRIGYFSDRLTVRFNISDRMLFYKEQPSGNPLTQSDAVSLYVMPAGGAALRFDAQLGQCYGDLAPYKKVFVQSGGSWQQSSSVPFTMSCYWRSDNGPNDQMDDEGWWVQFDIPFTSLGRYSPPPKSETWRIAAQMYDLDRLDGNIQAATFWPDGATGDSSVNWNTLSFGLPTYTAPGLTNLRTVSIRQGVNGAAVPDAPVGGSFKCGEGFSKWTDWGFLTDRDYGRDGTQANVQNQIDISDRPCFSRYYINFPLNAVPAGEVIQSATLRLYHFGNSDPVNAVWSYLQILRVDAGWNENSINCNNAPHVKENYAGSPVEPFRDDNPSGVPRVVSFDVTQAVVDALNAGGGVLPLAVYSADRGMHSGKYFYTSNHSEVTYRPLLEITWGDPVR
jgi:hypothetical protein